MQRACSCTDSVKTAIMSIINPASMPVEDDKVRQLLIGASTLAHGNLISPEQRVQLLWQLWAVERFVDSNMTVPSSVLRRACSAENIEQYPSSTLLSSPTSSNDRDDHVFLPPIHDARLVLRAVVRAKTNENEDR
jgi:hypothetical protein